MFSEEKEALECFVPQVSTYMWYVESPTIVSDNVEVFMKQNKLLLLLAAVLQKKCSPACRMCTDRYKSLKQNFL